MGIPTKGQSAFAQTVTVIGLAMAYAFAACCSIPPSSRREGMGVIITTSASMYRVTRIQSALEVTIVAKISNETNQVLYIRECEGFNSALAELAKRVGNIWERAFQPICEFRLRAPIQIPPHASRIDTAVIRTFPGSLPAFSSDTISGVYRALYAIHLPPSVKSAAPTDLGPLLPASQRNSNVFTLTE